jgi:hypothetical protein
VKKSQQNVKSPLHVGNDVLIRTVTFFHTGRIESITDTEVILSSACWIADTGRFADALKKGGKDALNEVEPFAHPVSVNRSAIIDVTDWTGGLPESQK